MSPNFEETIHVQTSHVLLTVMPEYLVCTGSLGPLGYQVVMVEMDVKESKVIRAAQGKTGPQGPPGPKGTPGAKGEPGVQCSSSEKGQSGESVAPSVMSFKNWKECAWKDLNEGKDIGLIKVNSNDFEKKNN